MTKQSAKRVMAVDPKRVLLGCALSWVMQSCASNEEVEAPKEPYFLARMNDLADAVGLTVGFGPGLLARAQCTQWLAVGIGSIGPAVAWSHYRFDPRFAGWNGRERGIWIELRDELGIGTLYACEATGDLLAGDVESYGLDARTAEDVAIELYLGLVGAAVTVRPSEVVDFLVGIFGADPRGDDAFEPR